MPNENEEKLPKATISDLEKRLAAAESALKDLMLAMKDIIKFNGREHMPDGKHYGQEF
ncbi:MAG: hypothetical protein AB7K68_17545 [Bacteriovoracia bacterium]